MTIIATTGHRPKDLGWGYDLKSYQYQYLHQLFINYFIANKPTKLINGMGLGIDMTFAFASLNYRDRHDNKTIVECAIPCKGQESLWPERDKKLYQHILDHANIVTYVSKENYYPELMQKRNEYMVNECDKLVAVWNGKEKGGTWNCIKYAKSVNKFIYYINPNGI